ncbi:MAG: 6-bladed beta-propeller [Candidatus Hydrogenedens sp.]|nr:6-bladed beta-propeller [Candidatus Hydrogenedens sp.]
MNALNRRHFLLAAGAAAAGLMLRPADGWAEEGDDIVLGQGDFRYRVVPGWGVLDPEKHPVRDCHGMVEDKQGRIILLTNHTQNNVIVYDKAGNFLESWGNKYPGAHGLAIVEEDGKEFLFITDHDLHKVFKTTLSGEEVMVLDFPEESGLYPLVDRYKPTDVAIAPNGDFFVCDGYGQFYVMKYDQPGKLIKTFGGPETMNTPHGACIDNRNPDAPCLLVAVRGKQELHRYDLDGGLLEVLPLPGADVCTAYVFGEEVYLPHLNGFVSIMDKANRVVSNLGADEPKYTDSGRLYKMEKNNDVFIHPHSILVDSEGSIYVPQWNSNATYPIKLERVKA